MEYYLNGRTGMSPDAMQTNPWAYSKDAVFRVVKHSLRREADREIRRERDRIGVCITDNWRSEEHGMGAK